MGVLCILIQQLANQGETMLVRRYGKKHGAGGFLFNGVICLFAMIFFFITDTGGLCFLPGLWKFGIINAILYASGFYFAYVAYRVGPYLLTHAIAGLSFAFPMFYGLFILKDDANYMTYLALGCTFLSFFLMLYARIRKQKEKENAEENKEEKKLSFLWLIATIITLVSNGLISILAKMEQAVYSTLYSNEYMIITLSGATIFLLTFGFITERKTMKQTFLKGSTYGMAAGLLNGAKNFANLMAISLIPLSLLSPLRSAIGKPLNIFVALVIYKERFTLLQYLSIGISILAAILIQVAKYI